MDMLEWLEPIIDRRCEQIIEGSIEGEEGMYYAKLIQMLKTSPNITTDQRYAIENLFILNTKSSVEFAYRSGLTEAIKFLK